MLYVAGDHYGALLAQKIESYCREKDIEYTNLGSKTEDDKQKLKDIIPEIVERLKQNTTDNAVLICGTGAGVEIGANRFAGIRACLCIEPKQVEYARVYDDANILCLSAWITEDPAPLLNVWFASQFKKTDKLVEQLAAFDQWH